MVDSASQDFYDRQLNSPNPIRRWWHNSRRELIHRLVKKYYTFGFVVDLGCGNCTWNYRGEFPAVGVDKNREALIYAFHQQRIMSMVCCDITDTQMRDGSAKLIVSSEVMEHIPDTDRYLEEIHRLLSPDGIFILTLPYDTFISAWKPLFAAQCFLKGFVQHDAYYINKCGHIHHYDKPKLAKRLKQSGFGIKELGVYYGMTLYCVAVKI